MKKFLFYSIISLIAFIFLALLLSLIFRKSATALLFGVKLNPIEQSLESSISYPAQEPDSKTEQIVFVAEAFLASLDEAQRDKVMFAFPDNEQRANYRW